MSASSQAGIGGSSPAVLLSMTQRNSSMYMAGHPVYIHMMVPEDRIAA